VNILVITQYFWPENFRINDLISGLIEKGHQITVLTGIPNYPEGKFFAGHGYFKNIIQKYGEAKIIRVPIISRGRGSKIRLFLNYFSFAFCASILAPLLCRKKYDLIFVYEPSPVTVCLPAIILKKIKSLPILFWVQDLWPESLSATRAVSSTLIIRMVRKLVHFIYHQCDLILVQSRAFIPSIESYGIDRKKIFYFPNNTEELYRPVILPDSAVERKNLPKGFIAMFAGNIGAAQDFGTIIDAACELREHKDIYWVILGDGRMRQWAQGKVDERGLAENFLFLGRRRVEDMPYYFSLADVLLVTLKNEYIFQLTVPAKVQSYLACAKPIVAALAGEGGRIIEESGAGLVCPPQDPSALAKKVLEMYHMEKSRLQEMGQNGRHYFENNFERTMLIDKLDNLLKGHQGS